ncbi:MAG TPA: hypothetical protein DEF45_02550 [Rhodopirellula sp.]|nr:hypothetical protein [Rhodopirellula sp.]
MDSEVHMRMNRNQLRPTAETGILDDFKAQIAMDTSKGCNRTTSLFQHQWRRSIAMASRVAIIAVLSVVRMSAAQAELWTDLQGTHTVEARMVGLWGDSVILELTGGKRVAVKLEDLRSESRIQAQKLAVQLKASRADRVSELQGNAAAASAAAPQPLPRPADAPAYQAPQANASVADFINQIDDAITDGHLIAVYDALPPSYRKDVDDVVKLTASQLNQASWQGLVGTAQRLGDVIVNHQTWFLSSPRIQALPPKDFDAVEEQILPLADLMRVGLSPEATNLNQLQTVNFGQWLTARDKVIAPYLAQLVDRIGLSIGRQVTVKSEKDGVAVISVEQDGASRDIQLVSIDGYWVPKTIADEWDANIDSLKGDIAGTTGMIDSLGAVVGAFNPALNPLANSQSSDQFHGAMDGLFSPTVQTALITLATALGKTPVVASNQGNGRGNSGFGGYNEGYGDEMGDDMGDEMGDDMSGGYGGSGGPAAFPGAPGGGYGGSNGRPPSPGAPGGPGAGGSNGRPPSPGAPGGPGAGRSNGRPPSPGAPGGPGGSNGRPPSPGAPGGPGAS